MCPINKEKINIMKKLSEYTTDKNFNQIMNENVEKEMDIPFNEGIDFDPDTKTVAYNSSHENYVDISIDNNPTVDGEIVPGVQVWSIFKRKKGETRDNGNPLVCALNGEGWTFRSEEDRLDIEKQINDIATKFAQIYPIGVTIIIPSGNELNYHIAEVVMSKSKNAELLEGAICKLTTEEVNDIVLAKKSFFRQIYKDNFNAAYKQLCVYFEEMDEKRDGTFSRHFIQDSKMRNVLLNTLKVSPDRYAKDSKIINGQDILIIDDTISRGQSIKEACLIMMESYAPKSITVLTLSSGLN
mgnify:FL=1